LVVARAISFGGVSLDITERKLAKQQILNYQETILEKICT